MKIAMPNLLEHLIRNKTASEVDEELQFHVEMLERKYIQAGMSAVEAKSAATKRFGNFQKIKQQCVEISSRNTLLRRVFKTSSLLVGIIGLVIHLLSSDPKVAHIGDTLIMIAISGRLLIYVRGLPRHSSLPQTKTRN